MGESIGFIATVISLIIIITFFVMASRLLSIKNTLKTILDLELRKPENRVNCTCAKCQEIYSVSILRKGELVKCPKCKELNRVP
jgi:Zn finger protein HypA/HybF involved in hydrogenase expression